MGTGKTINPFPSLSGADAKIFLMNNDLRQSFCARLRSGRLLAILRDAPFASLPELADCLRATGVRFVEVAMNTPRAADQILELRTLLADAAEVGAGTVLSEAMARQAQDAGATFLVSPAFVPEVQAYAEAHDLPTLPGALTPTECWNAYQAGAAMVKLFPAKCLGGPAYVKELRGPFRELPLLICGGVSARTAGEYLQAGADALAVGGSIFSPARLERGDFAGIREDLRALLAAASGSGV